MGIIDQRQYSSPPSVQEIMMDHALRSISYIADIGELVVIMARRRILPQDGEEAQVIGTTPKMICHVFESEEVRVVEGISKIDWSSINFSTLKAQFIAQSIGQAFQVAYMEFLKANGIEDHSFVKEMDYQEVLNSQEIYGDELAMFAKKELQKEVSTQLPATQLLAAVNINYPPLFASYHTHKSVSRSLSPRPRVRS